MLTDPYTEEEILVLKTKHNQAISEYGNVWEGAKWNLWDNPPIGQKVIRSDGATATVVGRLDVFTEPHKSSCKTCTCPKVLATLAGWWLLDIDGEKYRKYSHLCEHPSNLKPL